MRPADQLMDGDSGFTQVNARLHPSLLPAGVLAGAVNRTLELGDARARWAAVSAVWGDVNLFSGTPLAMARWWEPETGEEALIVVTGAERTDGGMGRAWKLTSSTPPLEISLGGHDVWTTCRLVPQRQALILCRQGNTRHYFKSSDIDAGTNTITLHLATPDIVNGDRVRFKLLAGATVPLPLADNTNYYAGVTGAALILYTDAGLTSPVNITTAGTGTFYVERTTVSPGPGGLGALPLLLEPGWAAGGHEPAWTRGFRSAPQAVSATIAHQASTWEALNHRFNAGQAVSLAAAWDVSTPADPTTIAANTTLYARPLDNHHFTLHLTAAGALLNTGALVDSTATAGGLTTSVRPNSYSGQPMVSLREGLSYKNRIVGLNGRANVAASDPGDFLHFTPFDAALTAALGNGDELTTLCPLGEDTLLLATESNVLGITGLSSNDPTTWGLVVIPGAHGCIAPLTAVPIGPDAWWLSRSGVVSVVQTVTGFQQGAAVPMSATISRKLNEVDWTYAAQSCAAYFNNRYFCAVPLKGQEGTPVNNCLLVYNFLAQGWEGYWEGSQINPVQFARHKVGGQERLCWLDAAGSVRHFDEDGLEDITLTYSAPDFTHVTGAIETEDLTRGYVCGFPGEKQFTEVELVIESWAASWSLSAITDGVNEETIYRSSETKDATKFLVHDTADFDQANEPERAALPYREDYSVVPGLGDNLVPGDATYDFDAYYTLTGLTPGTTYQFTLGNAIAIYTLPPPEAGWALILDVDGAFVATSDRVTIAADGLTAQPVTALIQQVAEVAVPDEGLATELHQVYVVPVPLQERDYSIQFRLTNTAGSLRLRSLRLKAIPEKG